MCQLNTVVSANKIVPWILKSMSIKLMVLLSTLKGSTNACDVAILS